MTAVVLGGDTMGPERIFLNQTEDLGPHQGPTEGTGDWSSEEPEEEQEETGAGPADCSYQPLNQDPEQEEVELASAGDGEDGAADIEDRIQALGLHLPDPPLESEDEDEAGAAALNSHSSIPMDPEHAELGGCEDSGRLVAGGRRRLRSRGRNADKVSKRRRQCGVSRLPLPPPVLPLVSAGWAEGTPVTRQLPPCGPALPLGFPIPRPLAPSSSSGLAPALGRYSPPLCRGNKMAAAVPLCARILSPPPWPPGPGPGRRSRGVRTHRESPSPRAAHFSLGPAFVCCFSLRTRARVGAHTPS
ncbi:male-enhanced antigen 1 isoform X2 [Sigmodon hispidus]